MKNRPIYYKSFDGQITVSSRKVSGYLASFNNKDADQDIILKGAFTKSLNERGVTSTTARKIAYLYQHDMSRPIGRFTALAEDEKGLYFEAELDNIPLANDVLEQYKSGTLNQHSIGFRYIADKVDYSKSEDTYYIKEVDLFEGSVVTMGANENTPFVGLKADNVGSEVEQLRRETEFALKHIPFEEQYKIRQLISKHISLMETEPIKITRVKDEPIVKSIDWNYIINNLNN
jgi:HK97 family phage prohead protease